ncbi:cellulase family glycosylhydrolase [Chitinophaga sp. sic0106]|uniref:cellulase family glycosylhydrolase n=1 Tax=Chitinophaga sp. sic0106 TaxID=2854785 RepID=UPI001C43DE22|nr:cellulase family glycosylhydrolase [Chitinophaga sp. sic0106]MBV7532102.1 cellulase family glycosylhydrolase [Chitinophaga sp. sic0106]
MKQFHIHRWLCMAILLLSALNLSAQTPVAKNGQLSVIGLKLCNQYGNPIQLRGMSTHGIQWYGWGSCLTEASLDALAYDWGADVLRISLYVQEGGYASDPAGFTTQVNRLIEEATERGMYALVDWHQLTPGDPNANLALAKTFFTAIANQHKNKNNIIYDVCNEPNGVTWATIKTYANQIIPVIRAIDNDAVILVGTHAWGSMGISDGRSAQDIVSNPLTFSNIMYTFHFYAADHGTEYLNELDWASDRLPVFVTEFGSQEASGDGPNDFTMTQQYIDLMARKKISWTNWNFSDDFRSGAVWITGTCSAGPWTTARLKPAGTWIRQRMLSPADDFPGGTTTPTCTPVTASSDDGNVAANVLDNNLNTRWSASGDGQYLQFCLNDTASVSGVKIAFYNGNTRTSSFDVQVSLNGSTWTNAATNRTSSGTSTALETFSFTALTAKYVRIVGHGNNVNAWNSYTEVQIVQQPITTPACTPVTASSDDGNVAANTQDNDLNTRWSATGDGQWIQFCLGTVKTVTGVQIAFYNGNVRSSYFDIALSQDGSSWTTAATGLQSSGTSTALQTFNITATAAKYVRIIGHGNSVNAWNSYTEVKINTAATLQSPSQQTLAISPKTTLPTADKMVVSPNPVGASMNVRLELKKPGRVALLLFDMNGKPVSTFINTTMPAGVHNVPVKTGQLTPGSYIIQLNSNGGKVTEKIQKL